MIGKFFDSLLKRGFALKGSFAPGILPCRRIFDDVEITAFLGAAKGAATISADFELEWAFRGLRLDDQKLMGVRSRRNMPNVLRILEEQSIPITWATVGHLFLESCERGSCGLAHPGMPRPPKNPHWKGDWYVHDPCTNVEKDPGWYAPDLITMVMSSQVEHEIGTHSFSHIEFSNDTSNEVLVRRELEECNIVMERFGLSPKSLVYPRNRMGHQYLALISDCNITSVRHRDASIRLSYPERSKYGVYKLYESMNLRKGNGYNYLSNAKIFLAEAMNCGAAYHFWFHPSDPTDLFEREFHDIICHIADLRNRGEIWVATMSEVAAYCEARQKMKLDVCRHTNGIRIRLMSNYDAVRFGNTDVTLRMPLSGLPKKCLLRSGREERLIEGKVATDVLHGSRIWLMNVPASAEEVEIVL